MRRTNWTAVGLGLCALLIGRTPVAGQDDSSAPRRLADYNIPGMDTKVNLKSGTVDAMTVIQLIEFLAHRGGISNLVIGQGVSGAPTKLLFDDVTVAEALEAVLSVNRLAYEIKGGILTIQTDVEYQSRIGRSFYDQKQTKIVSLKFADPSRVAQMLAPVKSPQGTVVSAAHRGDGEAV